MLDISFYYNKSKDNSHTAAKQEVFIKNTESVTNVSSAALGYQLNEHLVNCSQSQHANDSLWLNSALYSVKCVCFLPNFHSYGSFADESLVIKIPD